MFTTGDIHSQKKKKNTTGDLNLVIENLLQHKNLINNNTQL